MTKKQAIKSGFCRHCAAFWGGKPRCGVMAPGTEDCQLDGAIRERWEVEHGLKTNSQEVPDGTNTAMEG